MCFFRAISEHDLRYLNDNTKDAIYSSLYYNYTESPIVDKDLEDKYNMYFKQRFAKSLDAMIGHVNGKKLDDYKSPWISASTNFNFVVSEYAIPQAGNYNRSNKRKPIIMFKIDDSLVLKDANIIKNVRDFYIKDNENIAIDLRDNNLDNLNTNQAIIAEKYNDESARHAVNSLNREIRNEIKPLSGISGFSKIADEILVYKFISKKQIKEVIYPILQDIFYATDIFEKYETTFILNNFSFLENIAREALNNNKNSFLTTLYPDYTSGINLTDFLFDNYAAIKGETIEDKYELLKKSKTKSLEYIVNIINNTLVFDGKPLDLKITKLVDDDVCVASNDNVKKVANINDLLLIEKDGILYRYNPESGSYINKDNEDRIEKMK